MSFVFPVCPSAIRPDHSVTKERHESVSIVILNLFGFFTHTHSVASSLCWTGTTFEIEAEGWGEWRKNTCSKGTTIVTIIIDTIWGTWCVYNFWLADTSWDTPRRLSKSRTFLKWFLTLQLVAQSFLVCTTMCYPVSSKGHWQLGCMGDAWIP